MERIKKALEKARGNAVAVTWEVPPQSGASLSSRVLEQSLCRSSTKAPCAYQDVLERRRIVAGNKANPATASLDMLRTMVLHKVRREAKRIVGVTSPMPQSGNTTVAINLAVSIASQITKMVMLVDFNLRHPQVGEYLGIAPTLGLSDYLEGEGRIPAEAAVVDPGIPRLRVVPNVKEYQNAAEMLNRPAALSLVQRLRCDHCIDMAVLDLPPVLTSDATLAFLPQVDCLLVIVADGMTTRAELEETRRLLTGANVLGFVLNRRT